MLNNLSTTKTLSINADTGEVWDALTNPAKIKQYLFGTETITDWKTGSPIVFQGEWEGRQYKDKGVVLNIRQGEIIEYSYWSGFSGLEDKPENYSRITYKLEKSGNQTLLTLTQTGFANEQAFKHSESNWDPVLSQLKNIAEMK